MRDLWNLEARYATWVQVEVLVREAQAELGVVPAQALAAIRVGKVPHAGRGGRVGGAARPREARLP